MSKNFKNPLTSLFEGQPQEQIDQDEQYQKLGTYPANGNSYLPGAYPTNGSKLGACQTNGNGVSPATYPANGNTPLPGQYATNGNSSLPATNHMNGYGVQLQVYPTNGNDSLQFKTPITPLPNAPETLLPNSPSIWLPGPQAQNGDHRFQEQIKYYADWLAKQAKYDVLNDNSKEMNDYIEEATKIVKVGGERDCHVCPISIKAFSSANLYQRAGRCSLYHWTIVGDWITSISTRDANGNYRSYYCHVYPQSHPKYEHGYQDISEYTGRTYQ